jgi:hypothetical protein
MSIPWHSLRRIDVAMRIICALALTLVVLAHNPAAGAQPDFSAYALPDGSLPSLCLPGADGGEELAGGAGCELCNLASVTVLPAAPAVTWPAPGVSHHAAVPQAPAPGRRSEFGSRSLRGPPAIS